MVTLNTSTGDGSLRVGVDGFGSFGSNILGTETSDAFYDPLGELEEAGTVFDSSVGIGILSGDPGRTFFTEAGIPSPEFSNVTETTATSTFAFSGLDFVLDQEVSDLTNGEERTGSNLIQTYAITNPGTEAIAFELVRYTDGDLTFDGSIEDTGGRIFEGGQEILFEIDSGDDPESPTTFVGITASGSSDEAESYEISNFPGLRESILVGNPLQNLVQGDGDDENQFTEAGYDVSLALGETFTLAPGESVTYRTTTIFGSGSPEEVATRTPPLPLPDAIVADTNNDPRLVTWDGVYYGFQGVGEFVLVESEDRQIHIRQEAIGTNLAANTAIATNLDGTRVGIYADLENPVLIDGIAVEIADNSSFNVGDGEGSIFRSGDRYTIVYANGEQIVADVRGEDRIDIKLYLDDERQGQISGLLGNGNDDTADDLSLRDGTVLARPLPFESLYGEFADSWRITQEESLFDYGEGENTATFTDSDFPTAPVTLDDLDPDLRAAAEQQVAEAGIAPDSPLFAPTVIDLVTTQDPSVIEAAAETTPPEEVLVVNPPLPEVEPGETTFLPYSSDTAPLDLVNAIAPNNPAIEIIPESVSFIGADGQTSFYDGSLRELGIDSGILLTTGSGNPALTNTVPDFGVGYGVNNGDAELQAVADSAFEGSGAVDDVNSLGFSFNVTDRDIESVTFNLVFGSDEFPEFSNSAFVDIGAVLVNGQNVGLFNNDPNQPLSIIDGNLELGNFRDNNAENPLPIEYDGVSSVLTVVAPVQQGENTIRFGIADTGDTVYDSGLFISNLTPSVIDSGDNGSGVLLEVIGTEEADELIGDENDQFFKCLGGDDTVTPGAGDDIVDAGKGDDVISIARGDGNNTIDGGTGNDTVIYDGVQADFTIEERDGSIVVTRTLDDLLFEDVLTNVETIRYADGDVDPKTITDPIITEPNAGIPVYRFFNVTTQTQFYTTEEIERDVILETLPDYQLQGVSFVAAPVPETEGDITGLSPVYRFFNTISGVHLYTVDERERDFVEANLDNFVFEGTPYYGYDTQIEGTVPLYRFFNESLGAHFYTPSIEERDSFIESPDFAAQGNGSIAYYVELPTEV